MGEAIRSSELRAFWFFFSPLRGDIGAENAQGVPGVREEGQGKDTAVLHGPGELE
jgi:hypothetical protein